MSEKRYTFECNGNNCQIFENDFWLKIEEVVDLLNELTKKNERLQEKLKDANDEVDYWKSVVERYRNSARLDLEECTILQGNNKYVGKIRKFVKYENEIGIDLYDLKEVDGDCDD